MVTTIIIVFMLGAAVSFYVAHKSKVDDTKRKIEDLF